MNFKSLLSLAALPLVASPLFFNQSAIAETVSKYTNSGREYVIIDDVSPGDRLTIQLNNQDLVRQVTGNACGWIRMSVTNSYPKPAAVAVSSDGGTTFGADIDLSALTSQTYRCSNGVEVDALGNSVSPSSPFIDSSGAVVLPGYSQNSRYNVKYNGVPTTYAPTVRECGFVQITHAPARGRDMSNFTINGNTYDMSSISEETPPVCRTLNGQRVRYDSSSSGS